MRRAPESHTATSSTGAHRAQRAPRAEPVRLPLFWQRWEDVAFVHWRCDPEALKSFVPPNVEIDICDGTAWLGLVLFRMLLAPPPGPGFALASPAVPETNLRTYVRAPDGRAAVWFLSMDVGSRLVARVAGTAFRLPYSAATMQVTAEDGVIAYRSRRASHEDGAPAGHDIRVRPGRRIPARSLTPLDHFLTARYAILTRAGPMVLRLPIEHPPWSLHEAEATRLRQSLTRSFGLRPLPDRPLVHCAYPVDVRTGFPRPIALA